MAVDLATLAAFVTLALSSRRFWPLWIAGLQLTASAAHALKLFDANLVPLAYAAAERFWSYPILLIIAIGAFRAHRREDRARLSRRGLIWRSAAPAARQAPWPTFPRLPVPSSTRWRSPR